MSLRLSTLLPLLLTAAAAAQTTGVPGQNDLQVAMPPSLPFPVGSNPLNGGGQTSCFFTGNHSPVNFGTLHYQLSHNATTTASLLFFSFCSPCGGANNFPFMPPSGIGCAGPLAGVPLTNLWFSLNITGGCATFSVPPTATSPGFHDWRFFVPAGTPFGFTVWAQAVIIDPPCGAWVFKFSQAIGIS
jgi:hypothetical protein